MNEPVLYFNNSNSIYINLIVFNLLKSIAAKKTYFCGSLFNHFPFNYEFRFSRF